MKTKTIRYHSGVLIGLALVMLATVRPLRGATQDDRIERAFTNTYVYHTQLKNADISVASNAGVVTLDGRVNSDGEKQLAADAAAALPGVTRVDNKLEVYSQPPEMSDGWVALKVRGVLLFHRNVSLTGKQVTVADGVVTLTGTAANEAEKELTVQYAADVRGVKSVVDKLQIPNSPPAPTPRTLGEKIDDASVTAQLKYALAMHRSTSALHTEVSTHEGVVTIRGQARNGAEKDLVTRLAEDIQGVRSVHNEMLVQS